jgi:hypothetical protein
MQENTKKKKGFQNTHNSTVGILMFSYGIDWWGHVCMVFCLVAWFNLQKLVLYSSKQQHSAEQ